MIRAFESDLRGNEETHSRLTPGRKSGVCRLGEALNELLALYPPARASDDVDVAVEWAPPSVELVSGDVAAYSASRA